MQQRTKIKNRIHGRLTTVNLLFPRYDLYGRAGRAWLATVPVTPAMRSQLDRLLRMMHDALTTEIEAMDGEVSGSGVIMR